ncbi:MAG: methyltransferase domain-containing protein, partial [Bradymonadia bacterium]
KWTHFDWTEPLFGAEPHSPSTHYDLVVAFGVIHHIYHSDFRFKFLDWCAQHLSPGGHLIVSAWDFGRHEKFRQKAAAPDIVLSQTGIDLKALGPHDYFLSFGQQAAPLRYCHWMNDQESSNLIGRLLDAQKSLKLTARIEDPDDLNRYWVFTDTQR